MTTSHRPSAADKRRAFRQLRDASARCFALSDPCDAGRARCLRAVGFKALAIETGTAGLSIEDSTGAPARLLFELDAAVTRRARP